MSPRRLLQVSLLLVVVATVAVLAGPRASRRTSQPAGLSGSEPTPLTAYYFHGDRRCETCLAIEHQAEATLRESFADELAQGRLAWRAVNIDRPENAHYSDDFGLTHSTLVLVQRQGEEVVRYQSLERVWELAHEETAFADYVRGEVRTWLEAAPR